MHKQWKILVSVSIVLLALVLLAGCGGKKDKEATTDNGKIKVVATVYPVYEFVKQVGGDKVDVVMLIPPGAEPHDWEPTAKDRTRIKDAKIFAYHGAGFEPIEKLLTKDVLGDTVPVEVSKGVTKLVHQEDTAKHEESTGEQKGHKHDQEGDSHMWLDPLAAEQEVNTILAALIVADEKNAAYYKENAQKFTQALRDLDQEYKKVLGNTQRKDLITSHEAFGYLAARYGLNQIGIMGLSPDAEPTPDKMAEITKFCREHKVKYIFFETLASPKLAQTIAKETGADLLVLNPIENLTEEEVKQGKNYITIMKENLVNLEKALK